MAHRHVLVTFYVARGYAEVAVKCTVCLRAWAGNLREVDNPGAYYSPDEAREILAAEVSREAPRADKEQG